MSKSHPHAEVIGLWGSSAGFARDLSLQAGQDIKPGNARKMKAQGIPEKFWHAVAKAADAAGFQDVTYARLAELSK